MLAELQNTNMMPAVVVTGVRQTGKSTLVQDPSRCRRDNPWMANPRGLSSLL